MIESLLSKISQFMTKWWTSIYYMPFIYIFKFILSQKVNLQLLYLLLRLPWEVTAVMLADKIDSYKRKEQTLITEFLRSYMSFPRELALYEGNAGIVQWVERSQPRK